MTKKEPQPLEYFTEWKYNPALETIEPGSLKNQYDLFINGKFVKPNSEKYTNIINPATDDVITCVAEASKKDIDKAVKAARRAFETSWEKMPAKERAKYIFRIARLIQERAKELAVIETLHVGKPIRNSRNFDIPLAANYFFYYAGWADKLEYAFPNRIPKPLGVVAQIIPWNFPLLMAACKIAPALATGNTVVLHPSETTPLTALKLAEIIQESELPDGVINIVTGTDSVNEAFVHHKDIDTISFTGNHATGQWIQKTVAGTSEKFTLQLNGKSTHIILDDAAINEAVEAIVNSAFINQGGICGDGSRVFIQESIADEVIHRLKDRMATLIVGDPLDKNTDIGAIHSKAHLTTIDALIKQESDSDNIYQHTSVLPKKGSFVRPTLFINTSQSHPIHQQEVFGPVIAIQTFRTIEEVIEKANNIPYGLTMSIWCDKSSRVFGLTSKLQAGVVWVNTSNQIDPTSPFGGYKQGGMGKEGGVYGLLPYVKF